MATPSRSWPFLRGWSNAVSINGYLRWVVGTPQHSENPDQINRSGATSILPCGWSRLLEVNLVDWLRVLQKLWNWEGELARNSCYEDPEVLLIKLFSFLFQNIERFISQPDRWEFLVIKLMVWGIGNAATVMLTLVATWSAFIALHLSL